MNQDDLERRAREVLSLRRQGLLTQQEAYERHKQLLREAEARPPPPVVDALAQVPAPVSQTPISATRSGWSAASYAFTILVAVLGGALGILGALVQEIQTLFAAGLLLAFVGAPIIEEALKPAGIYILLVRWPQTLSGRFHIALLAALSGITFGLIESFVYVNLYYPEGGSDFATFRYTVPVVMHGLASLVVGLGLNRGLVEWSAGRARLPNSTRNAYLTGVALHAFYNIGVTILAVVGVLSFD